MQTATFKTTNEIDLHADIHGFDTATTTPKPVILWIHGGALIMGSRTRIAPTQLDRYLNAGFAIVTIDYRLAPETKLRAIAEDVEDAITWIRSTGAEQFNLDPDRLGVVGHSAGGYLTLLTGHRASPAPKALVAFYGYGNIAGDWYSKPDPFYNLLDPFTEEQAHAAVGTTEITDGAADPQRRDYYLWCRQNGLWPEKVGGHDPIAESDWFTPYSPADNVDSNYPPTLLIHGNADTDVPYEQSVHMAARLAEANIEHNFITIENGPHGFDNNPETANTPAVIAAIDSAVEFLAKHV
ncbi:MAG: alpha/beta hydrolase [Dehalococcoidia bacterium]